MELTTKPPTEPGFYWCRDGIATYFGYVTNDTADHKLQFFGTNRRGQFSTWPVTLLAAKWAGPIPEPKETA